MDKELISRLGTTWPVHILSVTPLENYGEYEKAECIVVPDGGDMTKDILQISAFGYSAGHLKKYNPGDLVEVTFIPKSRMSNSGRYFTSVDLIKIRSIGIESEPKQSVQKPEDTYPVGTKPATLAGKPPIQESDFDFG
jgi:hypothetical protein